MTEQALLNYFQDKISADELAIDLTDSQKKTSFDTTSVYITQLESKDEFIITKAHLLKLCNDVLNGKLRIIDINTIAFALMTSEFFTRNEDDIDALIIENVIFDWDNPEIGYALTLDNMKKWKEYLETGNYNFNKEELDNKFRNDRRKRNIDKIE